MTATFVEEPVLTLRGVDLLLDAKGSSSSDELIVQMKDWCYFNSYFIFFFNAFIRILTYDFVVLSVFFPGTTTRFLVLHVLNIFPVFLMSVLPKSCSSGKFRS
jgi:hypothetical protein